MDRESARQEVRARVSCKRYAEKSKSGLYCCPYCGSGKKRNATGALKIYPENTWSCFACKKSGDVIDLYQQGTGADYNTALSLLAQEIGIAIDPYRPATSTRIEPNKRVKRPQSDFNGQGNKISTESKNVAKNGVKAHTGGNVDYTEYYRECKNRLNDPAAEAYLLQRGISPETAAAYGIGFDPAADPASAPGGHGEKKHPCPRIIVPCSTDYYVTRRVDGLQEYKSMNPAGSTPKIFNARCLYGGSGAVFVTEGVFDALAIIECGAPAIAINSTANADALVAMLKEMRTSASLILALDNDTAGCRAAETIKDGMNMLNVSCTTEDICSGHKDPSEAFMADRQAFADAVTEAESKTRCPGLLTLERARVTLEAADERYLEMPNYPQLSATIKIKTHDTIVIAADTGAGKSSLALNFLHELHRYPALYINLEMDEVTILQRLVAIHTGMELDRIEGYKHDHKTREKVNAALQEITGRQTIQLITDAYSLQEIESQIKRATQGRTDPTIVFIDTGLLVTTASKSASRYERFTQISEELRRISRLNNVVMFVLLQQNREGKADEKKKPTNSSLKESGSWENDATKIMFLWTNPSTQQKEIAITKNRSGKTGSIRLNYSPRTQEYSEAQDGFVPCDGTPATPRRR